MFQLSVGTVCAQVFLLTSISTISPLLALHFTLFSTRLEGITLLPQYQ